MINNSYESNLPPDQLSLWSAIKSFEMDDVDSQFSFTDRLARENSWSIAYSLRTIEEYKRFIFLICISPNPLTPSDQVDQVWHLHLLYTQSYWIDWCRETLGLEIHHGPTKGGEQEKMKYRELYEQTKILYKKIFNADPPQDIWPSSQIRFGNIRFTRVNRHSHWVIPKFIFLKSLWNY
jgi:hypothetical protein